MIYWELFWSFFQIGLFSFGGGYAALALIQEQVVTFHQWIDMATFADIITISQMTPGPIAINTATFVGQQIAGLSGAVAATAGCIAPSCIIVTVLARLYYRYREMDLLKNTLDGLRPAVVALIGSAGLSIFILAIWGTAGISWENTNAVSILLFAVCVYLLRRFKLSPILVMCGAGVVGLFFNPPL